MPNTQPITSAKKSYILPYLPTKTYIWSSSVNAPKVIVMMNVIN